MRDVLSSTSERAASDDKRSDLWPSGQHGILGSSAHHRSVQVVGIVLHKSAIFKHISIRSAFCERWASTVLDHVRRQDVLAVWQAQALALAAARASLLAALPAAVATFAPASQSPVAVVAPVAFASSTAVAVAVSVTMATPLASDHLGRRVAVVVCEIWLQTSWESREWTCWSISDWRWLWRVAFLLSKAKRVVAWVRAVAEVRRLVHIDPQSIDVGSINAVEEIKEHLIPVGACVGMEPVREDCWSRPNNAVVETAIVLLQERVVVDATIESSVWTSRPDRRVNHDDIVLISRVDSVDEVGDQVRRETLWIQREDSSELHVIDVSPHSLERDICCAVVRNDFSDLIDVSISVFALVESKTPVRCHQRQLSDFRVLNSNVLGRWASHEVEVQNTTNDVVFQSLAALVVDVDIHAIGVQEEDTVCSLCSAMIEVDWMSTVSETVSCCIV